MPLVAKYLDEEISRMSAGDQFWGRYPTINRTSDIAMPVFGIDPAYEKIFKPSLIGKLMGIFMAIFAAGVLTLCIGILINGDGNFGFMMLVIVGVILVICLVVNTFFFDKVFNYLIIMSHHHLTIQGHTYNWDEISDTCIMNKPRGKATDSYLLIFEKNGTVSRYDLARFAVSDAKFAAYIEYYKFA